MLNIAYLRHSPYRVSKTIVCNWCTQSRYWNFSQRVDGVDKMCRAGGSSGAYMDNSRSKQSRERPGRYLNCAAPKPLCVGTKTSATCAYYVRFATGAPPGGVCQYGHPNCDYGVGGCSPPPPRWRRLSAQSQSCCTGGRHKRGWRRIDPRRYVKRLSAQTLIEGEGLIN